MNGLSVLLLVEEDTDTEVGKFTPMIYLDVIILQTVPAMIWDGPMIITVIGIVTMDHTTDHTEMVVAVAQQGGVGVAATTVCTFCCQIYKHFYNFLMKWLRY
jgi:hypothetical protein